ncbi:MAG: von Willebrand factor type A domain-containing protein [Lentisphaerae bacterium]|nr:von Willebrand factor type A domain-containing protein [Lentisphaerota bacterium]
MNCNEVRQQLTRYLLGDLGKADTDEIKTHLENCVGCRAAAHEIEPTLDLLRDALAADTAIPIKLTETHRVKIRQSLPAVGRALKQKRHGNVENAWPLAWLFKPQTNLARFAAMIFVLATVVGGLLMLPVVSVSRGRDRRTGSMSNLRQIDKAKMYKLDHGRELDALEDLTKYGAEKAFVDTESGGRIEYLGSQDSDERSDEAVAVDQRKDGVNVLCHDESDAWYSADDDITGKAANRSPMEPTRRLKVRPSSLVEESRRFPRRSELQLDEISPVNAPMFQSLEGVAKESDVYAAKNKLTRVGDHKGITSPCDSSVMPAAGMGDGEMVTSSEWKRERTEATKRQDRSEESETRLRRSPAMSQQNLSMMKLGSRPTSHTVQADMGKPASALTLSGKSNSQRIPDSGQLSDERNEYKEVRIAEPFADALTGRADPKIQTEGDVCFSPAPTAFDSVAMVKSPMIMKGIYGSRTPGSRGSALGQYGGSATTEESVLRSLRWLKTKQRRDGSWGGSVADTSVGLLAFLAHGETPASSEFGETTEKAIRHLAATVRQDGRLSDNPEEHAKAVYALNEAYALTRLPILRNVSEKAVRAMIENLSSGQEVTGWDASALKAAQMAGVEPSGINEAISIVVQKLQERDSADAALGLQILGAADDAEVIEKIHTVADDKIIIAGRNKLEDVYFANQAAFHQGGATWRNWNKALSPQLVKSQIVLSKQVNGKKSTGFWGAINGEEDPDTIYNTALASLICQVYYRYLPTFRSGGARDNLIVDDREIEIEIDFEHKPEEDPDGPRFKAVGVNPFVRTKDQAFSTFAIDVDTAAYTLARNYMLRGYLPPAESVRTEEFINFFDYAYKPPEKGTFAVYTDVAPSQFGRGLHMLKIGVKGRRLGREEQRRAALTFVVDTSGSMNTLDRIGLIKTSMTMLLDRLDPDDVVSIVQFGSHARIVLEHVLAAKRAIILTAIDRLQASGSTNLEEAMRLGYLVAIRNFVSGGSNKVLVLSDGAANLGANAAEEILNDVAKYKKQGVQCFVFGFGIGTYNDSMLETLANKGDGTYNFIDSEDEARRLFVEEFGATLNTIASDVKIQVEFNPAYVNQYRQLGYENRQLTKEQFRDDAVDAGEVGSGQSVTALYEVKLEKTGQQPKPASVSEVVIAIVRVRYRRTDTGAIEEMEHHIRRSSVKENFEQADVQFKLAVAVAEFAEILRGSPYAESEFESVAKVLRPVALELNLDERVQELTRLVSGARGMSRGASPEQR